MIEPPLLGFVAVGREVRSRYALLINPFYPKDPHASYGKHVLTPTLALSSIAAATPDHWDVRYWAENLLQGEPGNHPGTNVRCVSKAVIRRPEPSAKQHRERKHVHGHRQQRRTNRPRSAQYLTGIPVGDLTPRHFGNQQPITAHKPGGLHQRGQVRNWIE